MVNHNVLQHLDIKSNIESTSAHWRNLTKHHIFSDAVTVILLSDRSSLH